jgi:hypothetical protein
MARKKEVATKGDPHEGWKKLLYSSSIVIALGGSLVLLVFTFLINDALDKTRDLTLTNVQGVQNDLIALDGALTDAEAELGVVNTTLTDLQGTLTPLEMGLRKTGDSINGMANAVSQIPLIGQAVPVADLQNASGSMLNAAAKLNDTAATFEAHKAGMSSLKDKVEEIRQSVSSQEAALGNTYTSIENVFGLIKIANFLFFLVVISMFSMLVINSAAGLL